MVIEKLKEIRELNKNTYQQVADAVGISKVYYWQIENGKRGLSYELAVKIAAHFNLNPDDIFLPSQLTNGEQKSTA